MCVAWNLKRMMDDDDLLHKIQDTEHKGRPGKTTHFLCEVGTVVSTVNKEEEERARK